MAGKAQRTTLRSTTGTKLYAVRDKEGKFKDIQTYKRAHAADVKKVSKAEIATKAKAPVVKTPAPKVSVSKTPAPKAAPSKAPASKAPVAKSPAVKAVAKKAK